MTATAKTVDGHARYTFRLRLSSAALARLEAEWARCRWVWNECVAMSRRVHRLNKDVAQKATCGPAQLDKMLTEARQTTAWLREGASVPQQQIIRDFAKSRAKALKDIKARLPMGQRAGMPRIKRKRDTAPSLNYTRRGFSFKNGRLQLAGGIMLTVVWSRDLPSEPTSVRVYRDGLGHWYAAIGAVKTVLIEQARKHGRAVHLVHPAHTTMDCARCGARAKHALPLSERTYTCTACGAVSPGDKNSARVMLVRAGLNPAGADLVSPATC